MNKSRSFAILFVILGWLATSAFQPLPPTENAAPALPAASSVAAPADFGKVSPANGAGNQSPSSLVLQWNSSSANVTYQYCLRTNKSGCPASKWVNAGLATSVTLRSLTPGVTAFAIHAADGTPMAVAGGLDVAVAAILQHEMVAAQVH